MGSLIGLNSGCGRTRSGGGRRPHTQRRHLSEWVRGPCRPHAPRAAAAARVAAWPPRPQVHGHRAQCRVFEDPPTFLLPSESRVLPHGALRVYEFEVRGRAVQIHAVSQRNAVVVAKRSALDETHGPDRPLPRKLRRTAGNYTSGENSDPYPSNPPNPLTQKRVTLHLA